MVYLKGKAVSALELYIGAAATIFLAIATVWAAVIQAKDKKKQAVRDTSAPPPRETAVEPMESTAPDEPANGSSAYLRNEGDEYARMEQWEKAAKKYRAATELEPDSALNHDKLAGMLCRLGKYDEALDENIKAVARASDAAEKARCYAHKADTLWNLDRTADALADLQEAVRLAPDSAYDYYYNLGRRLWRLYRYEEAAEAFRKAAELASDNAGYYYDLGDCLRRLSRYEEAAKAFRKAAELAPDNAWYYYDLGICLKHLGICLRQLGQYKEAKEAFRKAEEAFRKAAELAPDNAVYYHDLGGCLFKLKRLEEAAEAFRKAVNLAPNNPFYKARLSKVEDALRESRTLAP